ncbi:MAG TPA: sulfatase-like hydrolase/transferase, partial [Micromonosporaceae bacterium]|nr:sulfatase-like hydrolase/transferase [Micromonosporaceae bacterium]
MTDEPAGSPTRPAPPPSPRRRWWRAETFALLELAAVAGVALAQPLLDIIGKSPDFFLFYGAGRREALLLLAAFVLVPPLVLWGVGLLAGLIGPRVRAAVHVGTLGGLLALLAVQVGKQALPVRGLPLVAVALLAGAALAAAYWKWHAAKQLVRLAAVGPVVFSLLFVFASPASAVLLGGRDAVGAAAGATGAHPPVVVIVLDELPLLSLLDGHGRIDAARYPNFARLAGGSTWYRNATGVSGWTPYAVPAMLTGQFPTRKVAPHYSQHPRNLFTLLSSRYDLRVQESITQLCPPRSCDRGAARRGGLPTMLGESATLLSEIVSPQDTRRDPTASFAEPTVAEGDEPPPTDPKFRWDTLDDNQPVRFREFVTGLAEPAGRRPTLHFLHLLLPHTPWRYLPNGMRYEAPEDLPTGGSRWWPQLARQRHLLQLRYADSLLGETLDALRDAGTYDESLIAVTADHGVSFAADSVGRGMGHVEGSPAEVLWVPMFVKAPRQRAGAVDDRNWQHVDLLPTIADYAGVKPGWRVDGVSARGAARAGTDKPFYDAPDA